MMTERAFEQTRYGEIIEENVSFEDFCSRYEGQPVEWHGGKVIQKMSNNERHQAFVMFFSVLLSLYLGFRKMGKIYQDGYQMRLVPNDPARQPDLLIVFKEHYERIKHQYLDGPADLVIEVISPGTGHVDRGDKYYEYQNAGVPEYWIIDPESKRVDVYHLDAEKHYQPIQGNGKIISQELPNFVLDTNFLWQDDLPEGQVVVDLVQELLKQN